MTTPALAPTRLSLAADQVVPASQPIVTRQADHALAELAAAAPTPASPAGSSSQAAPHHLTGTTTRLDANGTKWRLRSLVAMGHDATRIARALRAHPRAIRDLIRGDTATVTPGLHALTCQLWDAWWDKRPPERTHAQRRAASQARHRAEQRGWCAPLGLDEDLLDEPGYRPYVKYRPATGTGIAATFRPEAGQ